MRIIGGNLKGSKLYFPEDNNTRPLKDLVRESIFNLINHSNKIMIKLDKKNILDVYAGTGSFGLECLSRGAKKISFIESNKNSLEILENNLSPYHIYDNFLLQSYFNGLWPSIHGKTILSNKIYQYKLKKMNNCINIASKKQNIF